MFASYQITPDVKVDPTPAPADNIVSTVNGGVQVIPKEATDPATVTPPAPAAADPSRPAWLPEKFKTAEDMAKSYGELEKKLGAAKPDASTNDGKGPATVPVTPVPAVPADVLAVATAAKLDIAAMSTEFAQTGKLSDASMKSLTDAGLTADQVKSYVDGQTAIAAQTHAEIAAVAGGDDALKSVIEWAKANLSADDQAAYDAAIKTGNKGIVKMALAGVVSQYKAANGSPPAAPVNTAVPAATEEEFPGFKSNAEMTKAMADPRYAKDPAYNAMVAKRVRNMK
jgi:hypothetical protein